MRVAIIYRPKNTPPLEMIPPMLQGLGEWLGRYGKQAERVDLFAGGGGLVIIDVDDSTDLHRMTAENPFTPFADVDIRLLVDAETGLSILQETFAARGAG